MSESIDFSKLNLGADDATIARWKEEGLIKPIILAGRLRPVTPEERRKQIDAFTSGELTSRVFPENILRNLIDGHSDR